MKLTVFPKMLIFQKYVLCYLKTVKFFKIDYVPWKWIMSYKWINPLKIWWRFIKSYDTPKTDCVWKMDYVS